MAGAQIVRALDAAPAIDASRLLEHAEKLAANAPDLSTTCREPCDRPRPKPPGALRRSKAKDRLR
jgi:hypothetical protein